MKNVPKIYLASKSPRRAALLKQMGFSFQILDGDVPEKDVPADDPVKHVLELSKRKAKAAASRIQDGIVVGADTVVYLNGVILGKPKDKDEAKTMLMMLSGMTHEVFTGFTIIASDGRQVSDHERTSVTFRKLESWEVEDYVATGSPLDKAGAYGIQDRSGLFVDRIEGCFYNVVGFPLTKFYKALKELLDVDTLSRILRPQTIG
jgi:septum formation protein